MIGGDDRHGAAPGRRQWRASPAGAWPGCRRRGSLRRPPPGRSGPGSRAHAASPVRRHIPGTDYLTGPENELAMAAAQAMARGEHRGISPLVVHGPSGVGKSRLLAGLVAERLRREPGSAVAHLDAETFAASYAEAPARPGTGDGWSALRDRLRAVDLLVLEDLEGLARRPVGARRAGAYARRARGRRRRRGGLGADGAWDLAAPGVAGPADQPAAGRPDRADRPARAGLAPPLCPPAAPATHGLSAPGRGRRAARRGRRRLPHPRRLARPARARSPDRVEAAAARQGPRASTRRPSPPSWPRRRSWPSRPSTIDAIARSVAARFGVRLGAGPRAQPAGVGRRGAAPGHAPGPDAHRLELRRDRGLLRRSRPGHRPPRLPRRRSNDSPPTPPWPPSPRRSAGESRQGEA